MLAAYPVDKKLAVLIGTQSLEYLSVSSLQTFHNAGSGPAWNHIVGVPNSGTSPIGVTKVSGSRPENSERGLSVSLVSSAVRQIHGRALQAAGSR